MKICFAVAALAFCLPAFAQTPPPASTTTLGDQISRLSRTRRVEIVADSGLAKRPAPTRVSPMSAPIESVLDDLTKTLGKDATWTKILVPIDAKPVAGDDAAALAMTQKKLFQDAKPNLTPETAASLAGLNLRIVYVLYNPAAKPSTNSFGLTNDPAFWEKMTPEERAQAIQQAANSMASMDPGIRKTMVEQNAMIFFTMMGQMAPAERENLIQNLGASLQKMLGGGGGGDPKP